MIIGVQDLTIVVGHPVEKPLALDSKAVKRM